MSPALLSSQGCVKIENAGAFKPCVPTPERGNEGYSADMLEIAQVFELLRNRYLIEDNKTCGSKT